jgi:hypothetical protein
MPELDDLDRLLNAALETYAEPAQEPGRDSGLEQRVLVRIAAAKAQEQPLSYFRARRRIAIPWAVALTAAAALLLILLFERQPWRESGKRNQEAARSQTAVPAGAPKMSTHTGLDAEGEGKHPHLRNRAPTHGYPAPQPVQVAAAKPVPKLDVFPTPQPLTEQEQALVLVAARTPAPLRKALAEAQAQESPPVRIAAIHIPPLDSPDPGQN